METKTKSVLTYFNKIEVLCIINYFDLIHRLHDIKERNVEWHEIFFFLNALKKLYVKCALSPHQF